MNVFVTGAEIVAPFESRPHWIQKEVPLTLTLVALDAGQLMTDGTAETAAELQVELAAFEDGDHGLEEAHA